MPINPRSGRPRRTCAAQVRAEETHCHLCGYPIDLALDRHRHPLASAIDEIVPIADGGSASDRGNCRHAHRICNGSRGTKPITPAVRRRCRQLVETIMSTSAPQLERSW